MEETHNHASSVRDSVLSRIDTEGITPKPAWHFLLREWVVWGMAGFALVLGSVATSLSLYLTRASFFMERQIEQSPLERLFELIPLFWVMLLLVTLFYAIHAVRETRRGYAYPRTWLVVGALGASLLLGTAAEANGVGAAIDKYLLTHVSAYQPLTGYKPHRFMNAHAGVHAGTIRSVSDDTVVLQTLTDEALEITLTPGTETHRRVVLEAGVPIRVVGTTTITDGVEYFEAHRIDPFMGRGPGAGQGAGLGPRNGMKEMRGWMRSTE